VIKLKLPSGKEPVIAVIGLGYVGLPMAVEFAKKFPVTGFDINASRISELNGGHDSTLEVEDDNLKSVLKSKIENQQSETGLLITDDPDLLKSCNVFIVTVPTPVDKNNRPDLTPLIKASEAIGRVILPGAIVIYESTVYPGCTEEDCIPTVEKSSGMKFNTDFYAGYSPERINPGDKEHTFTTIRKVTSGSTPEVAAFVDGLYNAVVKAGTFMASSIKVAEMAKVIENSQRDINIAFVNEIARICSHFKIDTHDVLEAASTKWNFLRFKPGLVGGHCIGVDPYYLAQKAQESGYHPEIILAGRRMNDTMGAWIAGQIVKLMIRQEIPVNGSRVLVLGITFKENCPDIRNSKVIDVIRELKEFGCQLDVYDPWANPAEVKHEYSLDLLPLYEEKPAMPDTSNVTRHTSSVTMYDTVILAVAHDEFAQLDLNSFRKAKSVLYDIKGLLDRNIITGRV
jgi:UDP-N-acetyl-D-glucosamine/UDP-N-acetyl-D-galactosamine dehydrogenase